MRPTLLVLSAILIFAPSASADPPAAAVSGPAPGATFDPTEHWEADYESGILWKFSGDATRLSYTIEPQILTFKSPHVGTARPFLGGVLVLRSRFSLLGEPISDGPEHHFLGATASGIEEWWDGARTHCVFFSAGGGVGWLDSKGHEVAGGQGEDFNFTWLAYGGYRRMLTNRMSVSGGIYFQHVSNRNLNRINPGVNAAGPMLSVGYHF